MGLFRRRKVKKTEEKKSIPDGAWMKCDNCGEILYRKEVQNNLYVCTKCGFHFRVSSKVYRALLLDDGKLIEQDLGLEPVDFLKFKDYAAKIKKSTQKTGLKDAIVCGEGKINGIEVEACFMDFGFIGGSMGSVVGEKVKRAIYRARDKNIPLIIVSSSGGARMQEGIISLMQMAKTSAALNLLKTPYISILTNPTTAGVMASYASLGDVIIAEPGALLGFAGPRVIQQTIKQELPPGFQRSEFMLEHGMIDMIVTRHEMKEVVTTLLKHLS
ncbi:MAG TPA: acetyl-CoA carboxylase carboxyltransferase subunit beta [candidate division WOR-3 bacterium]|uniref:Acetyl-coenzyme A carboxylase carboxyl transferase subunit beta n=1 Tax=candidate division WOR-3 bacterium TaxID=2052148 RepID=A0A7C0ZLY4_UNCW3|nr:acetyl-CoA carboxylase carboxyltransferase subunit beta [candidate division WOR-3 bacterium]